MKKITWELEQRTESLFISEDRGALWLFLTIIGKETSNSHFRNFTGSEEQLKSFCEEVLEVDFLSRESCDNWFRLKVRWGELILQISSQHGIEWQLLIVQPK